MRFQFGSLSKNRLFLPLFTLITVLLVLCGAAFGQSKSEEIESGLTVNCNNVNYTLSYAYHQATLTDEKKTFARVLHVVLKAADQQSPSKVFGVYVYGSAGDKILKRDDDNGSYQQLNLSDINTNIKSFLKNCRFSDQPEAKTAVENAIITAFKDLQENTASDVSLLTILGPNPNLKQTSYESADNTIQQLSSPAEFSKATFGKSSETDKPVAKPPVPNPSENLRCQVLEISADNARLFDENRQLQQRIPGVWTYAFYSLFYTIFFAFLLWGQYKILTRDRSLKRNKDKNLLWLPPSDDKLKKAANLGSLNEEITKITEDSDAKYDALKASQQGENIDSLAERAGKLYLQKDLVLGFKNKLTEFKLEPPPEADELYYWIVGQLSEKSINPPSKSKRFFSRLKRVFPGFSNRPIAEKNPDYPKLSKTIKNYTAAVLEYNQTNPDDVPESSERFNRIDSALEEIVDRLAKNPTATLPEDFNNNVSLIDGKLEAVKVSQEKLSEDLAALLRKTNGKPDSDKEILNQIVQKIPLQERNLSKEEARDLILKIFGFFEGILSLLRQANSSPVNLQLTLQNLESRKIDLEQELNRPSGSLVDLLDHAINKIKKLRESDNFKHQLEELFNRYDKQTEGNYQFVQRILDEHKNVKDAVVSFANNNKLSLPPIALPRQVEKIFAEAMESVTYKSERDSYKSQYEMAEQDRANLRELLAEKEEAMNNLRAKFFEFISKLYTLFSGTGETIRGYFGYRKIDSPPTLADKTGLQGNENANPDFNALIQPFEEIQSLITSPVEESALFRRLRIGLSAGLDALRKELEKSNRPDVMKALYLEDILVNLENFIGELENWGDDDKRLWKEGLDVGFSRGWLHKLLRADRLQQAYFAEKKELDSLRHAVNVCAIAFENTLESLDISLTEVCLFKTPPIGIFHEETTAAEEIKNIREIRELVLKKMQENPNETFVVDITHFGFEGDRIGRNKGRVSLVNTGDWPESQ